MNLSQNASVRVGEHVFDLGQPCGDTPQDLCDDLADRLEYLAKTLRGPEATPAPPCEGCGAAMVFRRGHAGRFTVAARDVDGEVWIYGVHHVGTCVAVHEAAVVPVPEAMLNGQAADIIAMSVERSLNGAGQ